MEYRRLVNLEAVFKLLDRKSSIGTLLTIQRSVDSITYKVKDDMIRKSSNTSQ